MERYIFTGCPTHKPKYLLPADVTERAAALNDLLVLTAQREESMRQELAALKSVSSLQAHPITEPDELSSSSAAAAGASVSVSSHARQHDHQRQQRLEQLCAAAESCLTAMLGRISVHLETYAEWQAKHGTPEDASSPRDQDEHQGQQQRQSVMQRSRKSLAAFLRRASVLPPRRVSAVDLAASRGPPGAARRGSIEMPITRADDKEHGKVENIGAIAGHQIQRDGPENRTSVEPSPGPNSQPVATNNSSSHSKAHPAHATEHQSAVDSIHAKIEELMTLRHHVGSPTTTVGKEEQTLFPASSTSKGYPRSTLAGPAWLDAVPPQKHSLVRVQSINVRCSGEESPRPTFAAAGDALQLPSPPDIGEVATSEPGANNEGRGLSEKRSYLCASEHCLDPARLPQAGSPSTAQHAKHIDKYFKRLAGATSDPVASECNPFSLEYSDDDDQPVMDRGAVKHRSHKITHPKQPKNSPGKVHNALQAKGNVFRQD